MLNRILLFTLFLAIVACCLGVIMGLIGIISGGVAFPVGWQVLIPSIILFYVFYRLFKKVENDISKEEK